MRFISICDHSILKYAYLEKSFWVLCTKMVWQNQHIWLLILWIYFRYLISLNDFTRPGGWFNIKMPSYQYRKSHCGDNTVLRLPYLHNGISYTGKMSSLYWIRAQHICKRSHWQAEWNCSWLQSDWVWAYPATLLQWGKGNSNRGDTTNSGLLNLLRCSGVSI